jgi:hypothetical protein
MLHEKQAKSVIRKMIRKAKQDWTTGLYVYLSGDDEVQNIDENGQVSFREKDIIDAILCADETVLRFIRITDGRHMGSVLFVFDYDSLPDEIISDYTDNQYMNLLVKHAES